MYPRRVRQYTLEALDDSLIVLINGARQTIGVVRGVATA